MLQGGTLPKKGKRALLKNLAEERGINFEGESISLSLSLSLPLSLSLSLFLSRCSVADKVKSAKLSVLNTTLSAVLLLLGLGVEALTQRRSHRGNRGVKPNHNTPQKAPPTDVPHQCSDAGTVASDRRIALQSTKAGKKLCNSSYVWDRLRKAFVTRATLFKDVANAFYSPKHDLPDQAMDKTMQPLDRQLLKRIGLLQGDSVASNLFLEQYHPFVDKWFAHESH